MTLRNKGIPALVVTCAFAMFAVAAIPTHAQASSYYNGGNAALCSDIFCAGGYYYGDSYYGGTVDFGGIDLGYHYRENPTRYSRSGYPVYNTYRPAQRYPTLRYTNTNYRSPRITQDYFKRDYVQARNQWNAEMRYWQQFSI